MPHLQRAADAIASADALLIGAGAGMGVDSGLPDFRGDDGFWKAYPPFRGRRFAEMSNPLWFRRDPELAWGFFGHRMQLYENAQPHAGFEILKGWGEALPAGYFVFTSNVDGQFQKAGFDTDRILEVHGSLQALQCSRPCSRAIWTAAGVRVDVDMETVRAISELPRCLDCGDVARPNVLMFGDYDWISRRSDEQERRYGQWLREVGNRRLVAVELGAGTAIPTVRWECEQRARTLVRINPRDPEVPEHGIGIPTGALEALTRIAELLDR